jgi:ParB family chromosome partitioning protein
VTPAVVRHRLKLASAAPKLLDAYAEDVLDLEQLMAFCVSDDHKRQEQVLEAIQRGEVSPTAYNIRRLLTETCVEADDPRARFVGVDAYLAAGGTLMRDLFEHDGGGWLQHPEVLMRLVSSKLAAERERILAQGWKWVEATLETPYSLKQELHRLRPAGPALSDGEQERYAALADEHDGLIEGLPEDDIPEDVRARLDAIEAELAALDNRPPRFAPEDMVRGGALVSVGHNGRLNVEYGFLRPEDAPAADGEAERPDDAEGAGGRDHDAGAAVSAGAGDAPEDDGTRPLPERLVQDLTAYRTLGLRNALAQDFDVAFLAVLHAMCLQLFYPYAAHSCLQIKANSHFPANAAGLGDTLAAKAIDARHEHWTAGLPQDPRDLWHMLAALDGEGRAGLFAHCAGLTVNAVREPHQPRREALRHADGLAASLSLDMAGAGWATTADNYLARVTKARILDAVREARGEAAVQLIADLKKGDMAKEAERLLQGTGWLPEALRTPDIATASAPADAEPAPALPEFLAGGVDDGSERAAAE